MKSVVSLTINQIQSANYCCIAFVALPSIHWQVKLLLIVELISCFVLPHEMCKATDQLGSLNKVKCAVEDLFRNDVQHAVYS